MITLIDNEPDLGEHHEDPQLQRCEATAEPSKAVSLEQLLGPLLWVAIFEE